MNDLISPITVAIISFILGPVIVPFVQSYLKRRLKGLSSVTTAKDTVDMFSEDFKNRFILPDTEENYFYVQTGIRTNIKSVGAYLNLKNKLGRDFTWHHIRVSKNYLTFEGSKLVVSLNKWTEILKNVLLGLAIICLSTTFLITYLVRNSINNLPTFGLFMFVVLLLMGLGYLSLEAVQPILTARSIKKRLDEVESAKVTTQVVNKIC